MGTESRPTADQEREALLARTHPSPRAELPGPHPGLCSVGAGRGAFSLLAWPPRSQPSAVTFSVWLRDASEQTVLLPNELPRQLDVHIHLADPGEAAANVW